MSEDSERLIKYCVYCGAPIEAGQDNCPKCGKKIVKLRPNQFNVPNLQEKETSEEKFCPYCSAPLKPRQIYCAKCGRLVKTQNTTRPASVTMKPSKATASTEVVRKCSGCGSLITSRILDQCPICNTVLEPVPEEIRRTPEGKEGYIFTGKKLEKEVKRDTWSLKEGLNMFINSLMVYLFTEFAIIIFFFYQSGFDETGTIIETEITMPLIILSQIPGIVFAIPPLVYIFSRNHNPSKLGFYPITKKTLLALFIGIVGGITLIGINYLSGFIYDAFIALGLDFFDLSSYMEEEYQVIRNSELIWIIVLIILVVIQAISNEIVFRGVLHNMLKHSGKFEDNILGKITIIIIVAIIYGFVYTLFSFPVGFLFFLLNFMIFIVLGILYEINGNIYNTIIANIIYNIVLVLLMLYF